MRQSGASLVTVATHTLTLTDTRTSPSAFLWQQICSVLVCCLPPDSSGRAALLVVGKSARKGSVAVRRQFSDSGHTHTHTHTHSAGDTLSGPHTHTRVTLSGRHCAVSGSLCMLQMGCKHSWTLAHQCPACFTNASSGVQCLQSQPWAALAVKPNRAGKS